MITCNAVLFHNTSFDEHAVVTIILNPSISSGGGGGGSETGKLFVGEGRVATGQEMVREKQNSSRSGKSQEILF